MVTALLCHLLKTRQIDGAWVTRSAIRDGKLGYDTFIATTEEELRSASSSIYMNMPLLKHVNVVKEFDGKVAVVMTPCMLKGLTKMMDRDQDLKSKIVLKLGLYCSGNHSEKGNPAFPGTVGAYLGECQAALLPKGPLERPLLCDLQGWNRENLFLHKDHLCL